MCVVQIYNKYTKNHLFAIVYKIEHEKVFWYNPMSHTKEQITEEAFWELFTGCILVCDTHVKQTRPYEEEGYHLKRKEEKYSLLWQYVILVIFPLVLVAFGIKISLMGFSLYPLLLVILFSIGLFVSVLLMFYEIDQFNPSLSKVCQAGRKVSCQAVLNSVGAHFCGVSWSVWGSSYFGGNFIDFGDSTLCGSRLFDRFVVHKSFFYSLSCLFCNLSKICGKAVVSTLFIRSSYFSVNCHIIFYWWIL